MKAKEILYKAAELVSGARAKQHGDFRETYQRTAALWSAYTGHAVNIRDVLHMMALMKIARDKTTGGGNVDNAIDACGYEALAGDLD